jgi:hypothetical protein
MERIFRGAGNPLLGAEIRMEEGKPLSPSPDAWLGGLLNNAGKDLPGLLR